MWPFKKADPVFNLETYTTFLKRFEDVESRIRRLEIEQEDFRNKILRKVQTIRKQGAALDGEDSPVSVKKSGILSKTQLFGEG